MRRLLMGTTIGACLVVTASASAWPTFGITGARVDTTGGGTLVDVTGSTGGNVSINLNGSAGWDRTNGSAEGVNAMSAGNLAAVAALNLPLADNTLSYFGFTHAAAGTYTLGYFGIAFKNTTGSTVTFDATFSRTNQAAQGVLVAGSSTLGTYSSGGGGGNGTWSGVMTVAAGDTFYAVIGGFFDAPMITALSGVVDFGGTSRAVQYLSYSPLGGPNNVYSSVASANGFTSNMQFATYNIPVPAPALLAAAGLVGAGVVRRRMKK